MFLKCARRFHHGAWFNMQPMQRGQLCRNVPSEGLDWCLVSYFDTHPFSPEKSQPVTLLPTWKPIHHGWFWRRTKFLPLLFKLHNKQVRLKSWDKQTQQLLNSRRSVYTLLCCFAFQTQAQNGAIIIQSNIYMHTFDSHKRLWACGYLINMTGFMNVSGQRDEWWEDDRQGSSAPGTPEHTLHTDPNTHQWIQTATRPVWGLNRCL